MEKYKHNYDIIAKLNSKSCDYIEIKDSKWMNQLNTINRMLKYVF
jgi:hypothetical protein